MTKKILIHHCLDALHEMKRRKPFSLVLTAAVIKYQ